MTNRDEIIQMAGILVADKLEELDSMITELHDFLKVVRVCRTVGFRLEPDPSKVRLPYEGL